jgi:allophanate hydrolase subunit 1
MEIVPLGDSAFIVRVREQFEDAPEQTLNEVLQTFQQLRSAAIPGVIELAPAYTSVKRNSKRHIRLAGGAN